MTSVLVQFALYAVGLSVAGGVAWTVKRLWRKDPLASYRLLIVVLIAALCLPILQLVVQGRASHWVPEELHLSELKKPRAATDESEPADTEPADVRLEGDRRGEPGLEAMPTEAPALGVVDRGVESEEPKALASPLIAAHSVPSRTEGVLPKRESTPKRIDAERPTQERPRSMTSLPSIASVPTPTPIVPEARQMRERPLRSERRNGEHLVQRQAREDLARRRATEPALPLITENDTDTKANGQAGKSASADPDLDPNEPERPEAKAAGARGTEGGLPPAWLFAIFYLIGLTLLAVFQVLRHRRTRDLLRTCRPVTDPEVLAIWRRVTRGNARRARVKLVMTPAVPSPACCGIGRPMLILPDCPVEDSQALEWAIRHELVHLERGDARVAMLQTVLKTIAWFHPVVWWLSHQLDRLRELSCDLLVVLETGKRRSYAMALLSYAGQAHGHKRPIAPALLEWAEASPSQLRKRIEMLIQSRERTSSRDVWRRRLALGLLFTGLWGAQLGVAATLIPGPASSPGEAVRPEEVSGEMMAAAAPAPVRDAAPSGVITLEDLAETRPEAAARAIATWAFENGTSLEESEVGLRIVTTDGRELLVRGQGPDAVYLFDDRRISADVFDDRLGAWILSTLEGEILSPAPLKVLGRVVESMERPLPNAVRLELLRAKLEHEVRENEQRLRDQLLRQRRELERMLSELDDPTSCELEKLTKKLESSWEDFEERWQEGLQALEPKAQHLAPFEWPDELRFDEVSADWHFGFECGPDCDSEECASGECDCECCQANVFMELADEAEATDECDESDCKAPDGEKR